MEKTDNTDQQWIAIKFTAGRSGSMQTVKLGLEKTGSPTGTSEIHIYTDDARPIWRLRGNWLTRLVGLISTIWQRGKNDSRPGIILPDSGASNPITYDNLNIGESHQTYKWSVNNPCLEQDTAYWIVVSLATEV